MRALWIHFIEPRHQSFVRDDLFIAYIVLLPQKRTENVLNFKFKNDNFVIVIYGWMVEINIFFFD